MNVHIDASVGASRNQSSARGVGCDSKNGAIHYDSRYQLRQADAVLAEESEELVLRTYTSAEFLHELRPAGFSDARVVPTTDEIAWLRESNCALYECAVRGRNTDA